MAAVPSGHFSPFTRIHGISWFYVKIIRILAHNLFPCFPGPTVHLCLSGSVNLQLTQSSSSFLKTYPDHHNLFLFTTFTIPPVPNYCFNQTQVSLSLNFTPHIYVIILILDRCNASSFSLYSDHVSLLCNIEFSNQAS